MPNLTQAKPEEFSALEISDALTIYHYEGGRRDQVRQRFEENDIRVPIKTLKVLMRGSEKERSERIRGEVEPFARARRVEALHQKADLAGEVSTLALERMRTILRKKEASKKDLSEFAKVANVGQGIALSQAQELEGKPNIRVAVDFEGLLKEAKQLGWDPSVVLNGEAEEIEDSIEDAQLVEGDAA